MPKKNILLIVIAGMVILFLVSLGSLFAYREYKISKYEFPDYYKFLARKCSFKNGIIPGLVAFDCCLLTVKEMAVKNYLAMTESGCPEGYCGLGVRCVGAYNYCIPSEDTGDWLLPLPEKMDDTSDWKTYRNEEYGFEFRYPENWEADLRRPDYITIKQLIDYPETKIFLMNRRLLLQLVRSMFRIQ